MVFVIFFILFEKKIAFLIRSVNQIFLDRRNHCIYFALPFIQTHIVDMFVLLLTLWLFIIMFFDYFQIYYPPLSPIKLLNSFNNHKGDPLGIHDPSEAELGGVGHEMNTGPFVKRSRKILRGLLLMIIVSLCWVAVVHLFRLSFHRERILYTISAGHFNISKLFSSSSSNRPNLKQPIELENLLPNINNKKNPNLNEPTTMTNNNNSFESLPLPMELISNKGSKIKQKLPASSTSLNEFPRSKFDAPYLVTWYCSIWNIFYMPIYLMIHAYFLSRRSKATSNSNEQQQQQSGSNSGGSSAVSNNPFGSNVSNNNKSAGSSSICGTTDTSTSSSSSSTSIKKVLL